MSTEENKALLRRAWDEVYGQGRLDSIEEFALDDVIAHEPDGDVRGVEGFKRYLATYLAAFPDTSMTVEDVIAEGDKVVSRYTVRGTHKGTTEEYGPPTGKQVVIEGITLYHFKGGKLAEMWDRYDNLAVMRQLGLMSKAEPPSSIEPSAARSASREADGTIWFVRRHAEVPRYVRPDVVVV